MSKLLSAYVALGLPAGTSLVEALRRYRWLASAYHPDRFPDLRKAAAEEEMKRINNARDVLAAHYTQAGHDAKQKCRCVTASDSKTQSQTQEAYARSTANKSQQSYAKSGTSNETSGTGSNGANADTSKKKSGPRANANAKSNNDETNNAKNNDRIVILKDAPIAWVIEKIKKHRNTPAGIIAIGITLCAAMASLDRLLDQSVRGQPQVFPPAEAANMHFPAVIEEMGRSHGQMAQAKVADAPIVNGNNEASNAKWRSVYEPSAVAQAAYFHKLAVDRHERATVEDRRSIEELSIKLMSPEISSDTRRKLTDLLEFHQQDLAKEETQLSYLTNNPTAQ